MDGEVIDFEGMEGEVIDFEAMEVEVINFETGWTIVQTIVTKLKNFLELPGEPQRVLRLHSDEWTTLYTIVYNMCAQRYSQQVYNHYRELYEEYINSTVLPSLREKQEDLMLQEFITRWANHKVMVRWLSGCFSYLDRTGNYRRRPSVYNTGFNTFLDLVYAEMKIKVKDAVIALVDREREGEEINHALLKDVLGSFAEIEMGSTMGAHGTDFETFLLQNLATYYSRKGAAWIAKGSSCHDYMIKAQECLKRERERAGHYLHTSSVETLLAKFRHELLMATEPVANIFRQSVIEEGTVLLKEVEDATNDRLAEKNRDAAAGAQDQAAFVRKMIELHYKYEDYISNWFVKHFFFHKALKEAFEVFCNTGVAGRASSEVLATFCDVLIKEGDIAIDDTLEKVVMLLAYVNDKDLFAEFHRKKLARRLFFDEKNVNWHRESSFLTKLKRQCGGQLISKMEGMVTDMAFARVKQTQFEEYLMENTKSNLGIDLNMVVLSSGFWPSYKSSKLVLPTEMVKCVEVFKEFYETKTSNRKLTWIYSLGSCNMIGRFDARPIELIVTTYQAAVLLVFNDEERLSYMDIKRQLNFTEEDVVRVLHSLSCANFKILNKDPNTKTIGQGDTFEFNAKFTSKMKRIKILLPPLDEKKMIEDVNKERRYAIDALLVRMMKSRKQLNHEQLVMECVEHCGWMFKPDVKLIKKRIEDLITREYLERDIDNLSLYKYIA